MTGPPKNLPTDLPTGQSPGQPTNLPTGTLCLVAASRRLMQAGVPDPGRDARLLLADALGIDVGRLTLVLPDPIPEETQHRFETSIVARIERRPVSHILGRRQFYGRTFKVTEDVLDPRPETECLIALALQQPASDILDLGTGSGCILLTLLAEMPKARGLGCDVSKPALAIARGNGQAMDLLGRGTFQYSDWFSNVSNTYDLIVSNPPYISAKEMQSLSPDVKLWEPELALTPGGDGLGPYRLIAAQVGAFLRPNGRLLVEIGYAQGGDVASIFTESGLKQVRVHPDLDGKDRVVSAVL